MLTLHFDDDFDGQTRTEPNGRSVDRSGHFPLLLLLRYYM